MDASEVKAICDQNAQAFIHIGSHRARHGVYAICKNVVCAHCWDNSKYYYFVPKDKLPEVLSIKGISVARPKDVTVCWGGDGDNMDYIRGVITVKVTA